MRTEKIFRVKEVIEASGKKYFQVFGYSNKFEYFFGISVEYSKENKTFLEALEQIDTLVGCLVVSSKTVHVHYAKRQNKKQKEKVSDTMDA